MMGFGILAQVLLDAHPTPVGCGLPGALHRKAPEEVDAQPLVSVSLLTLREKGWRKG